MRAQAGKGAVGARRGAAKTGTMIDGGGASNARTLSHAHLDPPPHLVRRPCRPPGQAAGSEFRGRGLPDRRRRVRPRPVWAVWKDGIPGCRLPAPCAANSSPHVLEPRAPRSRLSPPPAGLDAALYARLHGYEPPASRRALHRIPHGRVWPSHCRSCDTARPLDGASDQAARSSASHLPRPRKCRDARHASSAEGLRPNSRYLLCLVRVRPHPRGTG